MKDTAAGDDATEEEPPRNDHIPHDDDTYSPLHDDDKEKSA